ncbi:FAD-dependent oxidoreductase [Thermopirellula anaerolimosa]
MQHSPSRRDFLTRTTGGLVGAVAIRSGATAGEMEFAAKSDEPVPPGFFREPSRDIPIVETADVVVCGAGPAGVSAAITAARAGARVRLLEVHGCLGGVWTSGLLSWVLDYRNKSGIMREIAARLEKRQAAVRYPEGAGAALAYRPEAMKLLLEEMCEESGVQVQLFTRVCAADVDESKALRLVVTESKSGRQAWQGKVFIDATGDGDLAQLAGCRFDYGGENGGPAQPMSLLAILTGLDPEQAAPFVRGLAEPLGERNPKARFLAEIRRGGVDPSYQAPTLFCLGHGFFAMMANHEYGVCGFDAAQVTAATIRARREIHRIIDALRTLGDPWSNVEIAATAEQIGVREGRRPYGRYRVTASDLIRGTRHEDAVCTVTFPVDIHSPDPTKNKAIEARGFRAQPYDIPFRALLSADIQGLLFAGRCISGDFTAHSSYRVTGNAAAMGEAAGAAAALAAARGIPPHELAWPDAAQLRSELARSAEEAG